VTTRVLVVDDDIHILRAVRIHLTARGYVVLTAPTGRAALQATAEQHPDLIVLDLGLPDLDGIKVISELRHWSEVPVIVLSARSDGAEKIAALDLGADDYANIQPRS
jgi:two-component system, OmpR family, KDP operon response regulator KdpE